MKLSKTIGIGSLIVIALLAAPLTAWAEHIGSWEPTEHDYGDVVLGTSATQIFTFVVTEVPLNLEIITLVAEGDSVPEDPTPYTGDAFTITDAPGPEQLFPNIGPFEVEVTFTPNTDGAHGVYLRVESDDAYGYDDIRIPLFGMGVLDEPDPGEEMADLIELFEASVADGSVEGYGHGIWAAKRLCAFRHILNAADNLIGLGYERLACKALFFAYKKSDGIHPPPDFIEGPGLEAVNEGIIDVMELLECWVCWE